MKQVFLFIFACILPWQLTAQLGKEVGLPLITNYSPKVYKGNQQVWSIEQDNDGLMFFGTSTGIVEYDGVKWREVPVNKQNSEIVRTLKKDRNGRIYYGGRGSFGYLKKDDFGITHAVSLLDQIPEEYQEFNDIWTTYSSGDSLYFQSREYIFRIPVTENVDKVKPVVWKSETKFMFAFYLDGAYYVLQQNLGLYKLIDDRLHHLPGSEFLGEERVQVMLPYPATPAGDKQYLAASFSGQFYLFDGRTFKPFSAQVAADFIPGSFPYRGIQLSHDTYGISVVGAGWLVIDEKGKLLHKFDLETGLISNAVLAGYQDASGMLWLGTDNGISRVEIESPITYFNKQKGVASSVLSVQRFEDELYLGTTLGLLKYNQSLNIFEKTFPSLSHQIFSMEVDGEDLLVSGDGLNVLRRGQLIPVKQSIAGNFSVSKIFLSKAHPDLMFCGGAFGVGVFSRRKDFSLGEPLNSWKFEGHIPGVTKDIYLLAETTTGELWASDQQETCYRIKIARKPDGLPDIDNFEVKEFEPEQIAENYLGVIFSAGNKVIFLAADGFYTYDESKQTFVKDTTFGTDIRTVNSDKFFFGEDKLGRVFIQWGDQHRLATPLPGGGYTLSDNPFSILAGEGVSAFYSEQDGTVWVGTLEGLIRIDEKVNNQKKQQLTFSTLLRQVTSGKDTLLLIPPSAGSSPTTLPFQSNSLRFSYAAPFFEQESSTLYQTQLEGFEEEWSGWDNNTYKEYTNLPAGDYRFRVRAKNVYNSISEEGVYSFAILPPWYFTNWAYAGYFLLFCALVFTVDRVQRRRLIARERKLSREKELAQAKEIEKAYHKLEEAHNSLELSHENLKAAQTRLVQQEKLASLGELTAGIAHEIQNPLNFVNNFSEVSTELVEELKHAAGANHTDEVLAIAADLEQNLSKIHHHGRRADAIVKGMLQHSRNSSGKKELTDLNALADEYLRLSYHGIRAKDKNFHADFNTCFDPNLPRIEAVPQEIGRVLLNLFNNAFYAVNERSRLYKEANAAGALQVEGLRLYAPKVTVSSRRNGDALEITVRDNGPGIPEEIKSKIFQPFFTTKPSGQGTGLGLSLAYDLITKGHGGELKVESKEGEFTEFILTLPMNLTAGPQESLTTSAADERTH